MPAITFVLTPKGSLLIGFKGEGPGPGLSHETGHTHESQHSLPPLLPWDFGFSVGSVALTGQCRWPVCILQVGPLKSHS